VLSPACKTRYESAMQKLIRALSALAMAAALNGCSTIESGSTAMPTKPATQTPQRFQKQLTRSVKLDYQLFLPKGYAKSSDTAWPLVLFLHGAGERGTNVEKVTVHGPPKLVKANANLPFIIVSPQCPEGGTWENDALLALVNEVTAKLNVDTNRVYLTGLSMGGYGSWSLATRFPERFAAVAPICGGGDQIPVLLATKEKKAAMKTLGVWAFHGAKDPVVPLEESQRMTNALMRIGCKDVKLTVYPEAGHDSWTQAYTEPEIWNWFLAHKR
jgi:predicted peptidase